MGPVYQNGSKAATADTQTQKTDLFEQIGRLKMELGWLKNNADRSPEQLRLLIEVDHPALSVRRQCELLGLGRSKLYYQPAAETDENLRPVDEEYTAHPFLGSRRRTKWLTERGEAVNRKRVQRLMRVMGREMLEEVLDRGQPEVFNTDHGVQFTSPALCWSSQRRRSAAISNAISCRTTAAAFGRSSGWRASSRITSWANSRGTGTPQRRTSVGGSQPCRRKVWPSVPGGYGNRPVNISNSVTPKLNRSPLVSLCGLGRHNSGAR